MRGGILRFGVLAATVLLCNGCVVLLGAFGAAGGARYLKGNLQEDLDRPMADVYAASKQAIHDLGLPLEDDKREPASAKLESKYTDGRKMSISIKAKTDTTCSVSIHVGGGDKRRSELVLENIKRNL